MSTRAHPHMKKMKWPTPHKKRGFLALRSPGLWAFVLFAGVLAGVLALSVRSQSPTEGKLAAAGADAPAFTLPSTDGEQVSLADYRGKDVLLYFNEGIGCDACFSQMADIEENAKKIKRAGLTVLPIVVNPVEDTHHELARFGIETPFLIDADKSMSRAYDVLGKGHHADLPGHSFVLVDSKGKVAWQKNYDTMFVSTDELLADMMRNV